MYRSVDSDFAEENYGLVISFMVTNGLDFDEWHGVVSEAYLRSILKHDSSRGSLSTFFYSVARNAVTEERRRLRVRSGPDVINRHYMEELGSGGFIVDRYELDDESLKELIDLMSDVELEIVNMIAEGYTHREIGEVTGLARSSVSSVMRRLRRRLEGEGYGNIEMV